MTSLASLTGSDRGVVDELEEMLSVAGDNSDLLAVLTEGIELIGVGGLELFASGVGELSFPY